MIRELKAEGAHYKLLEVLGHGQSATVFKAIREDGKGHSRQLVALKVLKSQSPVPWLRHEFETLARVRSPHCVRLIAWENFAETPALALELVDGVNLLQLGRSRALEDSLVEEIVAQTQGGLRELAAHGFCHGDLSPTNILIDREGCVRLVDFGLSNEQADRRGTLAYLAPEIWAGGGYSLAADLFALGLIANDLRDCFQSLPESGDNCRARAIQSATSTGGLLALDPNRRAMSSIGACTAKRRALGALVSEVVSERAKVETRVLPAIQAPSFSPKRLASSVALVVAATTVSVRAGAPLGTPSARSSLVIRSQKWLKVAVNGRDVGYSPISINGLAAGPHRVSWSRYGGGHGEIFVTLEPGTTARMTDLDLERLAASRDH